MRVIAGTARRLLLKSVQGMDTRPTTDRIKETLFNMINMNLPGAIFVDIFSGTGGIGIEALSRGAKECYFIDNSREAIKCINDNLQTTKLDDRSNVISYDALTAVRMLNDKKIKADYIFMDPPYGKDLEKEVLYSLQNSNIVTEDTLIIVEADLDTKFDYLNEIGFSIIKEKIYKTNKHVFIEQIQNK